MDPYARQCQNCPIKKRCDNFGYSQTWTCVDKLQKRIIKLEESE